MRGHALPLVLLCVLSGCGRSGPSVSGTVTYDGQPLASGYITFFPLDDRGPTQGTPIQDGTYEVRNITPGKKRVLITTPAKIEVADGDRKRKLVPPPILITADTPGNNRTVDIREGRQTLDIELRKGR